MIRVTHSLLPLFSLHALSACAGNYRTSCAEYICVATCVCILHAWLLDADVCCVLVRQINAVPFLFTGSAVHISPVGLLRIVNVDDRKVKVFGAKIIMNFVSDSCVLVPVVSERWRWWLHGV